VALRSQIVDFVGLHLLDDADEAGRIGEVAVVQDEAAGFDMRVLIQMIDAIGVKERTAALDAVDFIAFIQQKFGQVSTVLTRDAGDERFFCHDCSVLFSNKKITNPPHGGYFRSRVYSPLLP
jgi:hypothetical protein